MVEQACDLEGADTLREALTKADAVLADKAYDADAGHEKACRKRLHGCATLKKESIKSSRL